MYSQGKKGLFFSHFLYAILFISSPFLGAKSVFFILFYLIILKYVAKIPIFGKNTIFAV